MRSNTDNFIAIFSVMNIPKIVKDEAEKHGLRRTAAFLGNYDGNDIYSLGVDSKENWLPCPPDAPVIVAVKGNELSVVDDEEAINLAFMLCET